MFNTITNLVPQGATDSNFVGYKKTARSIYGYFFIVGGSLVSWKFKRASIVLYSILEVEYTGLIEGTKEVLWLRGLYEEMGYSI